jgi:hypothetical protein
MIRRRRGPRRPSWGVDFGLIMALVEREFGEEKIVAVQRFMPAASSLYPEWVMVLTSDEEHPIMFRINLPRENGLTED